MNDINGILNIYKPAGISSFACLSRVRRKLGLKKVGFLGTLDPLAEGVLVLLIGRATKMADKLHEGRKTYRSRFLFGVETESLDLAGAIIKNSDIIPTRAEIEKALPEMTGDIEIEVPKYSAVHIGGRRAYDLARAGVDFTPPKRVVGVSRFELLEQVGDREFFFEIECASGTYIRSLAKTLAERLGTIAVAAKIIRTRVGEFDIKDAKSPDDVTAEDIICI
jgi:tRNA pseudouridine55 synthase